MSVGQVYTPRIVTLASCLAAVALGTSLILSTKSHASNVLKVGDIFQDCEGCPSMVVVPAGSFIMGSPETEEKNFVDREGPRHKIDIAKPFAVGRFEVTVGQFKAFLAESTYQMGGGCVYQWVRGDFDAKSQFSFSQPGFKQSSNEPAVCISWDDAQAYVSWLSAKTGRTYRLLSEAEWEYVARAGSDTRYWWGDKIGLKNANFIKLHLDKHLSVPDASREGITLPVDSLSPNRFGLFNIHGNASEWTQDCWHEGYSGHPADGSPRLIKDGGDCRFRVIRGGSWTSDEKNLRSAYRDRAGVRTRLVEAGFRLARELTSR